MKKRWSILIILILLIIAVCWRSCQSADNGIEEVFVEDSDMQEAMSEDKESFGNSDGEEPVVPEPEAGKADDRENGEVDGGEAGKANDSADDRKEKPSAAASDVGKSPERKEESTVISGSGAETEETAAEASGNSTDAINSNFADDNRENGNAGNDSAANDSSGNGSSGNDGPEDQTSQEGGDAESDSQPSSEPENTEKDEASELIPVRHAIEAGESSDVNPLKGLIPFAGSTSFPHSLEWFYLPVNAVNSDEGVYNWDALEQQLDEIAARGHQAVLRFYYDYPAEASGVPDYLIEKYHLKMRAYDEPADLGGSGKCPDYSDENFRKSMQDFIAEFGKEYDGDPRIAFITEGLLGFWGEWHNWPFDEDISDGKPDWSIPSEVYKEVYQAYDDAFHITPLCAREPKAGVDNASYGTGYHDDSFAYATLSVENGGQDWSFMSRLKAQGVADNWKISCIGGEVYPPIQGEIFKDGEPDPSSGIQDWEACLVEVHPSWLMCDQVKGYTGSVLENAIRASKELGYDIQVTAAWFCDEIGTEDPLGIRVEMKNIGIAPFYYDHTMWPVAIGIKQGDTLIKRWNTTWDLCDIAADNKIVEFEEEITDHGLGKGEYSLCIKVINPLKGGVLFSFANEGQDEAGWLNLGTISVSGDKEKDYEPLEDDHGPGEAEESGNPADGENGLYEAENGVLEGKACLSDESGASGGRMVGWIGGDDGEGDGVRGTLTFDKVIAEEAGFYTIDIAYVLGEASRTATIDINGGVEAGGDNVEVVFGYTGGWSVLGTKQTVVWLREGVNSLKFHNDTGYAPNIDRIIVKKGSVTGILTIDGNLDDWDNISYAYADDFHIVKVCSDSDYLYFGIEVTGDQTAFSDWVLALNTDNDDGTGSATESWMNAGADYLVTGNGLYEADGVKIADGTDKNIRFLQKDNIIEIMVRKEALCSDGRELASTVKYGMEFKNDQGAVVKAAGEMGIYVIEETEPGLDTGKRFSGSNLLDWSGVDCAYDESGQCVWAYDDDEYLYFAIACQDAAAYPNWTIELNTDADSATGYQHSWIWNWASTGSDFKVENGALYRYTNGQQTEAVTDEGAVIYTNEAGMVEVKISKAVLGDRLARSITYGVLLLNADCDLNTAYITNKGKDMLSYQLKNVTEPKFGGADPMYGGWPDVNPAESSGNHRVWAADDENYLYFAMEYAYDGVEHWQILLNSDNLADTGMQNTWPFSPGGCDYLIEGEMNSGALALRYQESSDGSWTFGRAIADAAECRVSAENRMIEVRILKSALANEQCPLAQELGYGIRFIDSGWAAVGGTNNGGLLYYKQSCESVEVIPPEKEEEAFMGVLTDWSGISCAYQDSNMKVWVTDDADSIYYALEYNGAAACPNWSIELNTDGNHATGYQLEWIWAQGATGADYVVENGGLKRHTTDSADWSAPIEIDGGVVACRQGNGKIEVQISKAALQSDEKELSSVVGYGIEWKDADWNLVFASNGGDTSAGMQEYQLTGGISSVSEGDAENGL